jgi:hypothetical protein
MINKSRWWSARSWVTKILEEQMLKTAALFILVAFSAAWGDDPKAGPKQSIIGQWENTRGGSAISIVDSLKLGSRYGSVDLQWRPYRLDRDSKEIGSDVDEISQKNPYFRGYYYGYVTDRHGYTTGFGRRGSFTFYKHLAEVRIDPDGYLHISYWEKDAVGNGYIGETQLKREYHDVYRRSVK